MRFKRGPAIAIVEESKKIETGFYKFSSSEIDWCIMTEKAHIYILEFIIGFFPSLFFFVLGHILFIGLVLEFELSAIVIGLILGLGYWGLYGLYGVMGTLTTGRKRYRSIKSIYQALVAGALSLVAFAAVAVLAFRLKYAVFTAVIALTVLIHLVIVFKRVSISLENNQS